MDDGALIQYKNVEIHQQELCVLSDVNLELHKGEFVYLIGKVGSGKTSLLKTLYGELDVIDGEAEVLGYNMRSIKRKHIPQLRRKLGIVFQDFQLLTDRTVYNNLEFVLRATGWKNKREIQERIEEVLDLVGMSNKGYKLPNELSGGELQMVMLARALVSGPKLLILDEPESNLDMKNQLRVLDAISYINQEKNTACVINTHFPAHALQLSDKTLLLGQNYRQKFGDTAEIITENNVEEFFQTHARILDFSAEGRTYRTIAPYRIADNDRKEEKERGEK